MSFKATFWSFDPIGSFLFITSATLMLLALDWAGGTYGWSDAHVAAPLTIGLVLLVAFVLYGKKRYACHDQAIETLTGDGEQSGRAETMDWLPMYSSTRISTLRCRSLHSPLKDGSFTAR